VADAERPGGTAREPRLAALLDAYRGIAGRYEELESLSRREHEMLLAGAALSDVKAILDTKKSILEDVRRREEGVSEAKTWWSRVRRDLPAAETRELREVLDGVSRRLEEALALEAECRALLEGATTFRTRGAPSAKAARISAGAAYGRSAPGGPR
jgi:hypothetical protein